MNVRLGTIPQMISQISQICPQMTWQIKLKRRRKKRKHISGSNQAWHGILIFSFFIIFTFMLLVYFHHLSITHTDIWHHQRNILFFSPFSSRYFTIEYNVKVINFRFKCFVCCPHIYNGTIDCYWKEKVSHFYSSQFRTLCPIKFSSSVGCSLTQWVDDCVCLCEAGLNLN